MMGMNLKQLVSYSQVRKNGSEDYMFYETINSFDKVMYRLKMIDKNNNVTYSKILVFQTKATTTNNIKDHWKPGE